METRRRERISIAGLPERRPEGSGRRELRHPKNPERRLS